MSQSQATKMGVISIHKQRFWNPSRIVGLEDKPQTPNDFLDLSIGTEVEIVDTKSGQYLCHKDGYYCWIGASWVNLVNLGSECKCPTSWCPKHGMLGMR